MQEKGQKWVYGISIYMVLKAVLNLIINISAGNVVYLIIAVVAFVLLTQRIPFIQYYIQYVVAAYLVLVFLINVGNNISNFSGNWFYLLEGIVDLGAAVVLVFEKNVRAFFHND